MRLLVFDVRGLRRRFLGKQVKSADRAGEEGKGLFPLENPAS